MYELKLGTFETMLADKGFYDPGTMRIAKHGRNAFFISGYSILKKDLDANSVVTDLFKFFS